MQPTTKILNDRDKILFEKALKFYFFARQIDAKRLSKDVSDRLHYSGSVAYSLIITYAKTNSLKIEYMDFMNQELKLMLGSKQSLYDPLQIKPSEIDDIELMKETKLSFFDEDENVDSQLIYYPEQNALELKKV
ncbi:MAG: hypothetical protein ABJR05_11775 [Balneola sp.]|mmetsp:Transcript_12807/g.20782  ORF Transcript_12807/g.20782 Transcript_12807/m.20782 type:complete len:134 (+) Transcript_12807:122-523(+)